MKHAQNKNPYVGTCKETDKPVDAEAQDALDCLETSSANDNFISAQDMEWVILTNLRTRKQAQAYEYDSPSLGLFIDLAV